MTPTPYQMKLHAAHVARVTRMSGPCLGAKPLRPTEVLIIEAAKPPPPVAPPAALPEPAVLGPITVHRVMRAVVKEFGIDIKTRRRTLPYVVPRQIAMYLSRKLTRQSLPSIGRLMGGYDHTTILHGIRKGEMLAAAYADKVAAIEAALGVTP